MSAACVPNSFDGNIGLAFGIVTAAGLSTTLGAALAFVMPYSRSVKNLFLAACLAVAAGVMLYVSFIEIFGIKAVGEFEKCVEPKYANLYASLCFFGGVIITAIFDVSLHSFQHWMMRRKAAVAEAKSVSPVETDSTTEASNERDLEHGPNTQPSNLNSNTADHALNRRVSTDHGVAHGGELIASIYNQDGEDVQDAGSLIRMGIFAGIALAFHNFPEGLATFVAVLEDPSVGASVAIAIGIHNIPEGVCVAMPIFYATGSRRKAFFWATLSGMTELLGALLGWLILRNVITPVVYAILFGVVAGMMVYISLKELIPTAHRYDPDDQVTSVCTILGMMVMAASLVLFQF